MKKTLIFGLLLSAAAVVAQPKMGDRADLEQKKEKIEAIKVAYLTEELELTVAESQASPHSGAASRGPDLEPCCCNEVALLDVR